MRTDVKAIVQDDGRDIEVLQHCDIEKPAKQR